MTHTLVKKNYIPEPALFIVWQHCTLDRLMVRESMQKKFGNILTYSIQWNDKIFSQNLTRFYGEKLPQNSSKEIHIGKGAFDVFLFQDNHPKYDNRKTSRGYELVNTNLFDLKTDLREMDGGGHRVHGTINAFEGNRDTWLVLGSSADEILKSENVPLGTIKRELIGADSWASLEELLVTMNYTSKYIVMRNFDSFPKNYDLSVHGDIDFLVSDLDETVHVLNAKKVFAEPYRVHYLVNIAGEMIPVDIRSINDNYYDPYWSEELLNTRVKKNGFFIPNQVNHFYSLLYHALIHKPAISSDYKKKFLELSNNLKIQNYSEERLFDLLNSFMEEKAYQYTRPIDLSVYFSWTKVQRTDQAAYFAKTEDDVLIRGNFLKTGKASSKEADYRKITFSPLTNHLFSINQYLEINSFSIAIICPQFDTNFSNIIDDIRELVILCFTVSQKLFYEEKLNLFSNVKVVNLCFEEILNHKFDLIMVPNTLDLLPKEYWESFPSLLAGCIKNDGVIQIAYDQTFHADGFIANTGPGENFFAEEIQGRPRTVSRLRFDPKIVINKILESGFNEASHFGIYPDCHSVKYICNCERLLSKISFADVISGVGPKYSKVNKLAVFSEFEKQLHLPTMLKGQIYNLSKKLPDKKDESVIFAKFSVRNKSTSTLTIMKDRKSEITIIKKRLGRLEACVQKIPLKIASDLDFEVEHHSNLTCKFLPGRKLSSHLEIALLENDDVAVNSVLRYWKEFIEKQCVISSSNNTIWENVDTHLINGNVLDIGPHNLLLNEREVFGIDFEWQVVSPIPLSWYLIRNSQACLENFSSPMSVNYLILAQSMYQELLGLPLNKTLVENSLAIEKIFQTAVYTEASR